MQIERVVASGEERYCKFCEQWHPKNAQYWQIYRDRYWHKCRECQHKYQTEWRQRKREGGSTQTVVTTAQQDREGKRRCSRCRKYYPPTTDYFYLDHPNSRTEGKLRRTCIACHNTPRKKVPRDACSACGAIGVNLRGDVDLKSDTRHGYLCTKCSKVIEASGGDYERVQKVLNYLKRRQKNMINQNVAKSPEGASA